jgi:NADH dehydrogenase
MPPEEPSPDAERAGTRLQVVVVGGGFGGIATVRGLADLPVDVTLVDRRNHHLFQPLLYQVATAGLNPADIAAPIRSMVADQPNVRVLLAEVVGVEPGAVVLDDGSRLAFDRLVLAAGATHSYFGHDEWEHHAPGLKTVEDALEIRRRILLAFERAERTTDPVERADHLTFVVVGGGPTGVELAGAIAEIAFRTLTRDFRTIDSTTARVVLLEGTDRVLGAFPPDLSDKAEDQLERLGVEVRTGVMVTGVDDHGFDTTQGRIPARTVVWGAGNEASPLASMLGAPVDRAGRVVVTPDLSVPGRPEVFAVGDIAAAAWNGGLVPGVAQGAIQGGAHVARCLRADLTGSPRPVFGYVNKGELATIGRSSAVGVIRGLKLSGWVAWMAWWSIHIIFLIDFRSRLAVFISWAWNYLTFRRGARLITTAWTTRRPAR